MGKETTMTAYVTVENSGNNELVAKLIAKDLANQGLRCGTYLHVTQGKIGKYRAEATRNGVDVCILAMTQ